MYFNVAQDHERLIFIGVRNDLDVAPTYPKAQCGPQSIRQALGLIGDGGVRAKQFENRWRSLDKPSVTISLQPPILLLDGKERPLTFDECCVIQGFQDAWKWPKKSYRCLGNAVPPPFAKAVAEHVRDNILVTVNKQLRVVR
jgi:site-specific DNA-cytosine methylase